MRHMLIPVLLATLGFATAANGAVAPAPAVAAIDMFTIAGMKIAGTAESPRAARDLAMAQGRPQAWSKLFRRFTVQEAWGNEPQLSDAQLLGLILSVEVGNERRNTTRYAADVMYHFNPVAVRQLLRRSNIAFTEERSGLALVIPLTAGKSGFDPDSLWAIAWGAPSLQNSLVPMVVADFGATLPMPPNLTELDWAALAPIARGYNASQVIFAIASEDAKTLQMITVSAAGRKAFSFAFAQSSFAFDVQAIAEKTANEPRQSAGRQRIADENRPPPLVDDGIRTHLMANVRFETLADWAKLRSRLGNVKTVTDMDVVGLALNEAEIDLTYSGPMEQLRGALARHNLALGNSAGEYTLELTAVRAAAE